MRVTVMRVGERRIDLDCAQELFFSLAPIPIPIEIHERQRRVSFGKRFIQLDGLLCRRFRFGESISGRSNPVSPKHRVRFGQSRISKRKVRVKFYPPLEVFQTLLERFAPSSIPYVTAFQVFIESS